MREIAGQLRSGRERGHQLQKKKKRKTTTGRSHRHRPGGVLLPGRASRRRRGREGAVLLAFSPTPPRSPLPWAIMLKLTWLVLIQITRTMLPTGYHVNLHKPRKNAVVQIPLTPLQSQIYSRQQTAQKLYESKWC